jgi:alkylated DNA repair dioxygenase AlkB
MEQLKLFEDDGQLVLPQELMVYKSSFFSKEESDFYLQHFIQTVPWKQRVTRMYDKDVVTPRLNAWFGDAPEDRQQDNSDKLSWTPELLEIKARVEDFTGIWFNGVLLNFYRDGNDSVAWHSDKDTVSGIKTEVASISFGQARNFDFRSKANARKKYSIQLEHGALLVMKGELQTYWEHRIAKSTIPMKERINLTFRIVR